MFNRPFANGTECSRCHIISCVQNSGICCTCSDGRPLTMGFVKTSVTRSGVQDNGYMFRWGCYCYTCRTYWTRRLQQAGSWESSFPHSLISLMNNHNLTRAGAHTTQPQSTLTDAMLRATINAAPSPSASSPTVNTLAPQGNIPVTASATPRPGKRARRTAAKRARAEQMQQRQQSNLGTTPTPASIPQAPARDNEPRSGGGSLTTTENSLRSLPMIRFVSEASAAAHERPDHIPYIQGVERAPERTGLGYNNWNQYSLMNGRNFYPQPPAAPGWDMPSSPLLQDASDGDGDGDVWGRHEVEEEEEEEEVMVVEEEEWETWPSDSLVPTAPTSPIRPINVISQAPPPFTQEMRRLAEDISITLELIGKTEPGDNAGMNDSDYKQIIDDAFVNISKIRKEYRVAIAMKSGGLDLAQDTKPVVDDELKVDSACIICCEEISDTVLIPCNHLVLCTTCSDRMGIKGRDSLSAGTIPCPICRRLVQDRIKIFRG